MIVGKDKDCVCVCVCVCVRACVCGCGCVRACVQRLGRGSHRGKPRPLKCTSCMMRTELKPQ